MVALILEIDIMTILFISA